MRLEGFTVLALLMSTACNEYVLRDPPPVPPAEPPGKDEDDQGGPPDWANCFEGFHGEYSNLSSDHPAIRKRSRDDVSTDPSKLDWWSEPSFQQFDPTLDLGSNWWPVDEGLEQDPAHFAVRWRGWLRAWSNTTLTVTVGSSDDSWVFLEGNQIVARPGLQEFEPEVYSVELEGGQYPLEVLYAHRDGAGDSGFRFRVLSGDVSICYPEWNDDETE